MGSSKKVTIGYKYYLGMHLAMCHGPVDKLTQIQVGERVAWTGNVTGNSTITIDAPDLFGGETKEGGVQGQVDVLFGGPTQTQNAYLQSQLGTDIPAFRGVVSLVLNQVYVAAMSPYPKPWAPTLVRTSAGGFYPASAEIGTGSANGAHIVYECLTNPDWGLGLPPALINEVSFQSAADSLKTEIFGLSFIFSQQGPIENFIQNVLQHINGVLYTDRTDGKFNLRLLRDPTVDELNNALVLSESNIVSLKSFQRPSYAEMINEVIISYRKKGETQDSSITVQDLASIQAQGYTISQKLNYPGIDSAELAGRVAIRELRQNSTPLAVIKVGVNREASSLVPGDVVKFSWPDLNISNLVARVTSINFGSLVDGEIGLELVEDVFSLAQNSYISTGSSEWVNPVTAPLPAPNQAVFQTPYWTIARDFDPALASSLTDSSTFLQLGAAKPNQATPGYDLYTQPGGGSYVKAQGAQWTPYCKLAATMTSRLQTAITINSINSASTLASVVIGTYAYIGTEAVRVDAVDPNTGTMTIGRGCLDTVPQIHLMGADIYFVDNGNAGLDPEEYAAGETIKAKALTQTGSGVLALGSAPESTLVTTAPYGRQAKPYPPGNLRVNGNHFPSSFSGEMVLTWSARNRLTQTVTLIDFTQNTADAEPNVDYRIQIYRADTMALLREAFTPSLTYTYTTADAVSDGLHGTLVVRVASRRDTDADLISIQQHEMTLVRNGLGFNLGQSLGGV